jgi:glutaminyl-peptide cyclotransferase
VARFRFFSLGGLALAASFLLLGCGPKPDGKSSAAGAAGELWKEFSGERAMADVRKQVEIGPRPSGTAALETARQHITETLQAAGWTVERQEFEASPVKGKGAIHYVNLIGRFSASGQRPAPATTQKAIVCSHYDTKRMLGVTFVGANDAGSSTGALMELARVLAKAPALAEQIELVFFDGEEAMERYSENFETGPDGLVGSRHYATQLRAQNRNRQFQFAILWDMIGDKDLQLTLPTDSPRELSDLFFKAGDALNLRRHLGFHTGAMMDDHVPLQHIARINAIDLIDFNYLPWHTSGDTLDQLSPNSLQIIGQLTLWVLVQQLAK